MATCLGKQFEVGKGHGQVGGPGRGGANQFPWGGQLVEKKGHWVTFLPIVNCTQALDK